MVEIFGRNSQRVKVVGYFRRRASSWMFGRSLNATLSNNLLQLEKGLKRSFPLHSLHKRMRDSPTSQFFLLTPNRKATRGILGLTCALISLSNTRSENIKNSFTRQIKLTRVTNSRAVAHKSWMLPSHSGILAGATSTLIRIVFLVFLLGLLYTFTTCNERKNNEQLAKSNRKQAKSNEQRAKINKQQAKSHEKRAKSSASILY